MSRVPFRSIQYDDAFMNPDDITDSTPKVCSLCGCVNDVHAICCWNCSYRGFRWQK